MTFDLKNIQFSKIKQIFLLFENFCGWIRYLLTFFIQDIHQELIHYPLISKSVYRGLLMTMDQIEFLNQNIEDQTLRFNSFLIANKNEDEILNCLKISPNTNGLHKVLFEIHSNNIGREYQQFVIFPLNTFFRIISIRFEKRIWFVNIFLLISEENTNNKKKKNPIQLADYLRQIGLFQESEKLFYLLLNNYPCLSALCYDGLGRIAQDKGLYETSLHCYNKSLQIKNCSFTLNNIGCAYYYLEQYEQALQFYSQSLTLMKNELNQSICINNIGITYAKNNQFQEALQCFQNCLQIRKKYLSQNHLEIGICYTNIAVIQSSLSQFDLALQSYNIALNTFSSNKFFINRSIIYQNMAKIFQQKNQFDRAIEFYQDALNILQQSNHPMINLIKQQIIHLKQINQFIF